MTLTEKKTDYELVEAALEGSKSAWDSLYQQYDKTVCQSAREVIQGFAGLFQKSVNESGPRSESYIDVAVEDVSQEVWLKLHKTVLRKWTPNSRDAPLEPWLREISKNCARDLGEKLRAKHYGSRGSRGKASESASSRLAGEVAAIDESTSENAWKPIRSFTGVQDQIALLTIPTETTDMPVSVMQEILYQALNALTADQRASIELYLDNVSIKEISKQTGVNENTLKSRIKTSKKILKKEFLRLLDE